MDVYELVEKLGGEIVRGRARVRQGKEYIVIGEIAPNGMVFTPAGAALAQEHDSPKPEAKPAAPKRSRKSKDVVEEPVNDNATIDDFFTMLAE
jgi:hypothetical protein